MAGRNRVTRISVVHTVTWQDEYFRRLEGLGTVVYHPGYPSKPAELADRIGEAEIVVSMRRCLNSSPGATWFFCTCR
jgi:hypothetical protein